jgi:outer membrane protein assembly factor BamB
VAEAALAESWPASGPERLWTRELGEGYSSILAEAGRLYTMYREAGEEVVICLDAATGETLWEYRYEEETHPRHLSGYNDGPRSTPVIDGDRLFTVGVAGRLHALAKADGRVLWSRELWGDEWAGSFLVHGYSSSPVAYGGTVIVSVGGEHAGLIAFEQADGSPRWQTPSFKNSYSSPRLVELAGEPQLLAFMSDGLIGVDPASGEVLWNYAHQNQWGHNISLPAVVGGDTIFLSSPQTGARGVRVSRLNGSYEIEELWSTRRVQLYHVAAVQDGEWIYGSTGVTAPSFMTAINMRTGEIGWRERGFSKANCLKADGKLVILDEDGVLYLTSASPESLVVLSRTQLVDRIAWTVPTMVGSVLYARDNRQILAVDLS